MIHWPANIPQNPRLPFSLSPAETRTTFAPQAGEPVSRPLTTGVPMLTRAEFVLQGAEIEAFDSFHAAARGGRFAWREPRSGTLRLWRILKPYSRRFETSGLAIVNVEMMMLPVSPWFGPYAREGYSILPAFVADYANDIYGIGEQLRTAADMPSVAGTYLVRRATTTAITLAQETLAAGDIPESQPAGTLSIIGYPL